MIPVLIFGLVGVIIGFTMKPSTTDMPRIINGLLGVVIGLAVGAIVGAFIGTTLPSEYVLINETELVALRDNSVSEGGFFLGCGSIKSKFYYFFYKKDKDGRIRFDKLIANNRTSIVEEDRKNGVLRTYQRKFIENDSNLCGIASSVREYEIHIPIGSISRNFKLDLK